jgi:cell division septation protein DedD
MSSFPRIACLALLFAAPVLSACDTIDKIQSMDLFDTKKKLPGERRPVFPEGVPGVVSGVPPELVKGYREPEDQAALDPAGAAAAAAAQADARARPRPKPPAKPQQAAKPQPARKPADPDATRQASSAAATAPASAPAPLPSGQLPWPSTAPQVPAGAAWPGTPPPSR